MHLIEKKMEIKNKNLKLYINLNRDNFNKYYYIWAYSHIHPGMDVNFSKRNTYDKLLLFSELA
jgi:hypothetical protein